MAPLGWGLPAHPAMHCCDSLYVRPAVDLAKGKAQLRKAMCSCTNGRTPLISVPAVASALGADGGAALNSRTVIEASIESKVAALAAGRGAREHSTKSFRAPPPWNINNGTNLALAARHTDLSALLRADLAASRAECTDQASWRAERWAGGLVTDTVHLWLDNLDPHSLSFLRASVVVAETFWFVQLRCFTRVNGVMARVLDTKLSCKLNDDAGIVHRERAWHEGSWAHLCSEMTAAGDRVFSNGGAKSVPPVLPRCVDFGGLCDRLASERLPLRQPVIYDHVALPGPRSSLPTVAGSDSDEGALTLKASSWKNRLLWERQLRCEILRSVRTGQGLGRASDCILIIDRDGTRVGVMHSLKDVKAEEAEQTSRWRWRRAAPGNSGSILLSAAANSHRAIMGVADDDGKDYVSLLALGDGKLFACSSIWRAGLQLATVRQS
jgi:hypothetical protein